MTDTLSKKERSVRMGLIRHKDTTPELTVRKIVHGLGYRYRLHGKGLPGRPDLVFRKKKKVIFVHGCFWHRHGDSACKLARMPKSRLDFWEPKLTANRERDDRNRRLLEADGWSVLVVWECELSDHQTLAGKLRVYLQK